jgi:hypothetical protein
MQMNRLSSSKRLLAAAALAAVTALCAPHGAKAQTYQIDDGTAENGVGLQSAGATFMCLNSFAVTPGNNTIISLSIAWGTPINPDPTLNGLTYTAVLWSDPNGDGLPQDAVVLATAPGVIAGASTNTFLLSPITPTTVLTPNFFVGFIITQATATQFPAAFDQTAPTFPNRSFAVIGSNINDLSGAITIESAGLVGNWLIRATAIPEPSTYALAIVGLGGLFLARRKARSVSSRA